MLTVNLWDSNFPHQSCSVAGQVSRRVRYVRDQMRWDGITVFTDGQMFGGAPERVQSPVKVGWLHEGRALHPENYERAWDVRHYFDEIWTYDQSLLDADPDRFKLTIRGGTWVPDEQWGFAPKTRHAGMILSDKQALPGHLLRQEVARTVPGLDLYGPAHTPIGVAKAQAWGPTAFAVVIEATQEPNFFSEHLLDALACGCVVLYHGCPTIGRFLDTGAIIPWRTIAELRELLTTLDVTDYRRRLPALTRTLRQLPAYAITEDWQAEHRYPELLALLDRQVQV